jgi:hypothetical protein
MTSPQEVVLRAVALLDELRIPYLIGGSLASSIYGTPRTTADVDVVIAPRSDQLEPLETALRAEFYVSREAMEEAFRTRRSFNAIHLDSVQKIDFFMIGQQPFDVEEFSRRILHTLPGSEGAGIAFKTAEDTVLRKLQWYRAGGERSEQQWRDVLGVLAVQSGRLDEAYMDRWANHLGVSDLLARARTDAAS